MLKPRSGLSVAAVVILLADVALANIIVQPGYGQPGAHHSEIQQRVSFQEEKQNEPISTSLTEENARYDQGYAFVKQNANEGRTHMLGYQPLWQTPHVLPLPYNTAPKIVHPVRVTKIGGMGYVQPSFIVGNPQFPTYAVPQSRHIRSTNEKHTSDSDAVAPNPTLINISRKRTTSKDVKLEDQNVPLPSESDDTQEKREKRLYNQPKNEDTVGQKLGINPEKMYVGYREYQPPVMMEHIHHPQFSPPRLAQQQSSKPNQQVTPLPEKESGPAPSLQNQRISLSLNKGLISNTNAQASSENSNEQPVKKKEVKPSDSSSGETLTKNEKKSTILIENVSSQPVKRQGFIDSSLNLNIGSDIAIPSGSADYPMPSGPSGPPSGAGIIDDSISLQSDLFVGSARQQSNHKCEDSQRNAPDPRPHKHKPDHQQNKSQRNFDENQQQVSVSRSQGNRIPVAADAAKPANACNCQPSFYMPSILPRYSLFPSSSFYYRPIRIQPLQTIVPRTLGCDNTKLTWARTPQVSELTEEPNATHSSAAKSHISPQADNYVWNYMSAYPMPSYRYSQPYYVQYYRNAAPQVAWQ